MTTLAILRGYLNAELGVTADSEASPYSTTLRNRAIASGYAALWRKGVGKPVQVDLATVTDQIFYSVTGLRRLGVAYLLDSTGSPTETVPGSLEQRASAYVLTVPILDANQTIRLEGWYPYFSGFSAIATISTSSVANPTVITTAAAHGFATGDSVTIAGHTGSTPSLNGVYTITVTGLTTFTIPVNVSVGGTGGTADQNDDLDAEFNRIPLLKAKAICYRQALGEYMRYGVRQASPPEMNATVDQLLGVIAAAEREFESEVRDLAGLAKRYGQVLRNRVL